jgi:hypothetical protein
MLADRTTFRLRPVTKCYSKIHVMNNESLTGSLVLIHPKFKDDPVQKQGQIGVMTYPRELTTNSSSMPKNDSKALCKSMPLIDLGASIRTRSALEMARDNPGVWERTLDTIVQTKGLKVHQSYRR